MREATRSWTSILVVAVSSVAAFFIAAPSSWRNASAWMTAATFAVGIGVLLVAFLEIARALRAWLTRRESMGWIGAGMLAGLGLFVAGEEAITNPSAATVNWIALAGIFTAAIATYMQQRAARTRESA
jgi:drug/metabolite transporter (DMT)-like permease